MMKKLAGQLATVVVGALLIVGCGGGDDGPEGTYTHAEEGTITLSEGGEATMKQEGQDPVEFEWEEKGDDIAFIVDGEEEGRARIEDGDLVLPPDMISGDEDVTFERE